MPGLGGFCRECMLKETELAIADAHPELKRSDVFDLMQEWLRALEDAVH